MACTVDTIDIDGLRGEVDQLWAEAVTIYREMRAAQAHGPLPLYLSNDEASAVAKKLQEERRVETVGDTMAGMIQAWLERPLAGGFDDDDESSTTLRQETCGIEIWVEALGHDRRSYDSRAQQSLGQAMAVITRTGEWNSVGLKNTEKYGRQRTYYRRGYLGLRNI